MESGGYSCSWVEFTAPTKPNPHLLFGHVNVSEDSYILGPSTEALIVEEGVPSECLDIRETKTRRISQGPLGTSGLYLVWLALSIPLSTTDWAKQRRPAESPHADSGVHGVAPPSCIRMSGRDWPGTSGKGIIASAVTT